jgi:hypothetical protein
VIRSGATEFRYERGKQPLPRIDPWRGQLDGLLLANEGKAARDENGGGKVSHGSGGIVPLPAE